MIFTVRFTPEALAHLDEIENHIADKSAPAVAARYVDAIVDYCEAMQTFPHRGTSYDEILPRLRTVGFRRSATIAFEVLGNVVNILGIYYGGRDYEADLSGLRRERGR